MVHDASKKAVDKIVKALDILVFSPSIAARALSNAPGPIQHRLWLTMKVLIKLWAVDARGRTYEPHYKEIYDWAERIDNGND